ncbi:unnamed protein product [Cuscuta europaea]|uniref:FAR1 domain-containing protein n=1 Tax=Cuscuta europaea TaxID=41803 RepID=A0A9P0YND2_CUSEU|nr:unnamed protein product [Cuscuta europaea]
MESEYWIPERSPQKKPLVGMIFVNLDAAFKFYKDYASELGLSIRHHTSKKTRDGHILMKYIVCSIAGFKNNACPPVSDTNVAGFEGCPTNRKRVSNTTDTNEMVLVLVCHLKSMFIPHSRPKIRGLDVG